MRMMAAILGIVGVALFSQNCAKVDFAALPNEPLALQSLEILPETQALVYGDSNVERQLLAEKIAGYQAPSLGDVFNNWRRISGGTVYNSVSAIKISEQPNSYCLTELLASGLWKNATNPAGKSISPSTASECIDLVWFASVSWAILPDGRLHNASNSGNFNGFISGLKFDHFTHQAVLSSVSTDDDEIALIIATVKDMDGKWHTLSASRTQGGYTVQAPGEKGNWRIVHRKENEVVGIFGEKRIGSLNTNGSNSPGDGKGWNSRSTLVRVDRNGNRIRALTSDWGQEMDKAAHLPLVQNSLIEIDLDDESLGLSLFKGPAYIGYGIQSQPSSRFSDIKFGVLHDERYVFDLRENKVYEQNSDGTYGLRSELDVFEFLGVPRKVSNVETQLQYLLQAPKLYQLTE